MWRCLSDGARFDGLIFQEGQMPVWPGSVFSALIMQAVSEEACERVGSTVKGLSVREGGGAGAAKRGAWLLSLSPEQIQPTPGRLWATGGVTAA